MHFSRSVNEAEELVYVKRTSGPKACASFFDALLCYCDTIMLSNACFIDEINSFSFFIFYIMCWRSME